MVMTLKPASDTTKSDSVMAAENNPMAREYYLKDLPFTEEEICCLRYIDPGCLFHLRQGI